MNNKLLYPFAWLFEGVTSSRNWLYNRGVFKSSKFDIPIINVGNISVGGNGKTPKVEYLVDLLNDNYKVAVLSRGYGRKTKGFLAVSTNDSYQRVGDEPLQIKRKFGDDVKVFVGENRVEAVTKLLFENPEIQVIILDDAFQHRAIEAGLNLLLTDYSHIFVEDSLMPMGRLRENIRGAHRADAIVVTKCPEDINRQERDRISEKLAVFCDKVFFSTLSYGGVYPLLNVSNDKTSMTEKSYLLVSGIAKPLLLENHVRNNFQMADKISFPDHHSFTNVDIVSMEKKISIFADQNLEVLTTEKDAVRFLDFYNHRRKFDFGVNVLPIRPTFMDDDKSLFDQLIIDYVRENSTDSKVYKRTN